VRHRCPRLAPVAAVLALLAGCGDDPAPVVHIAIVAPDGTDPTVGTDVDTIEVRVRQGAGDVITRTSSPEALDLAVPLGDSVGMVELAVELTGPTTRLLGAPPPFFPAETGGFVRVVVGPPGACVALRGEGAALAAARAQAATARVHSFALVAGGVGGGGPSARVEVFDLLRMLRTDDLPSLATPAGPTSAAPVAGGRVLLVPAQGAPAQYALYDSTDRLVPITLHAGAGERSAVVPLPGGGAVVVGGASGGAPVTGVTWVSDDGTPRSASLAVPRAAPAAALVGDFLLVAGGMADGEPLVEILGPADATGAVVAPALDHGARDAPILASRGNRAWLLGGLDGDGLVRTDTLLISGCPDACVAEPGPDWPEARTEVGTSPLAEGLLLVGGAPPTDLVERVRLDTAVPRIEEAWRLAEPRAGAGAVILDAGIPVVLTGRGPEGFLSSVELCLPDALARP
jgi:hypothetical protein